MKTLDITGQKFGRLTALYSQSMKSKEGCYRRYWICKCECGNTFLVRTSNLTSGNTRSCGCLKHEMLVQKNSSHNMSKTRLYRIWNLMKARCFTKTNSRYQDYGGRGITIADEWLDFIGFYEWAMSHGYAENLTIERIDVNGNYEPDNCKWITLSEQNNNRRNTLRTSQGMAISIVAKEKGLPYSLVHDRVKRGWKEEYWFIPSQPPAFKMKAFLKSENNN